MYYIVARQVYRLMRALQWRAGTYAHAYTASGQETAPRQCFWKISNARAFVIERGRNTYLRSACIAHAARWAPARDSRSRPVRAGYDVSCVLRPYRVSREDVLLVLERVARVDKRQSKSASWCASRGWRTATLTCVAAPTGSVLSCEK